MPELSGVVISIVGGVLSLALGWFIGYVEDIIRSRRRERAPAPSISYKEKISSLTRSLVDASAEIDRILKEVTEVSHQRESAIADLEKQLQGLIEREKNLQEKINTLEKVPLPAVEYFVEAMETGEKRSAYRDYLLFGLGVVVSTVIAIALKLLFGI